MILRRAFAPLVLILSLCACTDRAADEAFIRAGERDWGHAFVTGDVKRVAELLAIDFRGIDTDGHAYTRAQMLRAVFKGPNITSDTLGPLTIRFYGDTAVVQGSEHIVGALPDRKASDSVWTDIWVRRQDGWRIVAAQDMDPGRK